jgi:hypothetical protein
MKKDKKADRAKKVKAKILKKRTSLRKNTKEQSVKEQLLYKTRQRKTPIVNPTDSALLRNNKVLQEMMAEYEALLLFREENKDKSEEMFQKMQEENTQLAKDFKGACDEQVDG